MAEIGTVLAVIGLFLLRVGLPIVLLIALGLLIDRWQTKRNAEIKRMQKPTFQVIEGGKAQAETAEESVRKAA
jgi:hypothetical protein